MRKYLFCICLFLLSSSDFIVYANTTLNWNNTTIECPTEPGTGGRTKYGVPSINTASAPTSGTLPCNTHYYYASGDTPKAVTYNNGGITSCAAGEQAYGTAVGAVITMKCRKYDDTAPVATNITYVCPVNELAINPKSFAVTVDNGGRAPITGIDVDFEQVNNPAAYDVITSSIASSTLNFSRDISKVDGTDRDVVVSGGRQYTFRVVRLKDEAGNELVGSFAAPLKNCDFNVYANSQNITMKQVGPHTLASGLVADGQSRPMQINLADTYGNSVIPAIGIGRTIDFNFNTNNWLYLSQYARSGQSSVFSDTPNNAAFSNRFAVGNALVTNFTSQSSSDGTYPFNFKVYTPTYQNYQADPNGKFAINYVNFDVNGTLGPVFTQPIASSFIVFNFKPLYQTALSGDVKNGGFIEGARENSNLAVTKNISSRDGTAPVVQLEFGGLNSSKFKLYGGTTVGSLDSNQIASRSVIQNPVAFPTSNNFLFTKLIQNPGSIASTLNTYLSTHISYTLDGLPIVYNSDIVGKDNYFGGNTELTQQNGVKILGLTATKSSQELVTSQFTNDVKILGNMNKLTNKTEIIKNAYNIINTTSIGDQTYQDINKLDGTNLNGRSLQVSGGNILYFGDLNGTNVTLGNMTDVQVSGKRTVLIVGGNLYIKSNLFYNNPSSILGIVVLKDRRGKGGNIYIDPDVTNIVGTLFAEKSVISYNGSELDGNTSVSTLKNQLHIYGNLFSENTIGGSRKSTPQCPYYITSGCDVAKAQMYDLNYLRRYYLVGGTPYDGGKVIGGGGSCTATSCSGGNPNFARNITNLTTDRYGSFPVLLEYNARIQTTPPPLFNIKS